MPELTITGGADAGGRFQFDRTPLVTVGRGGVADVALTDSSVSRRHARLACDNGAWAVEDLGSANGTFVNGRLITAPTAIAPGDVLRFGSVQCTFTDRPAPGAPADATRIKAVENEPVDSEILLSLPPDVAADAMPGQTLIGAPRRSRLVESFQRISAIMFDERALLSFVANELLDALPQADRVAILMWDAETKRFVPLLARTRTGDADTAAASKTLLQNVITRKEALLVANVQGDRRYSQSESMVALRMTSAIGAPVLFQNDILGVVQVATQSGAAPFTRADVALVMALALEVGMAVSYARLHEKMVERELVERDLTLARRIQRHFLPARTPEIQGYGFAVEYRPALAVGGDLYDFVQLSDTLVAIAVGDVSGKGISAALFAAKVTSDLRYQAAGQSGAAAILHRLNTAVSTRNEEGMFVTVALAVIDTQRGRLVVASAGHPLPIVRDGAGHVMPIGCTGDQPIGLDPAAEYREYAYEFEPGDSVVLYTDGVTEAANANRELYGDERLTRTIATTRGHAADVVAAISTEVRTFAGTHPQSDDVTVVCFERVGQRA